MNRNNSTTPENECLCNYEIAYRCSVYADNSKTHIKGHIKFQTLYFCLVRRCFLRCF